MEKTTNTPETWWNQLYFSGHFHPIPQNMPEMVKELSSADISIRFGRDQTISPIATDQDKITLNFNSNQLATPEWVAEKYASRRAWWADWPKDYYKFNPFEKSMTETLVLGRDKPEVSIFNFGTNLTQKEITSLQSAYEWFGQQTDGEIIARASRVIIGNHLENDYDKHTQLHDESLGLYDRPKRTISLDSTVLLDSDNGLDNLQELSSKGVSMLDAVMTHELAHAIMHSRLPRFYDYQRATDWQTKIYKCGLFGLKEHKITGIGTNVGDYPVTDYGYENSEEDFAEAMVYYRFAPELLDGTRYKQIASLFGTATEKTPITTNSISIQRMPTTLYPQLQVPLAIYANILKPVDRRQDVVASALKKIGNKLLTKAGIHLAYH